VRVEATEPWSDQELSQLEMQLTDVEAKVSSDRRVVAVRFDLDVEHVGSLSVEAERHASKAIDGLKKVTDVKFVDGAIPDDVK
jgi:hypothetical protein